MSLSPASKAYLDALSKVPYHGPRIDVTWSELTHTVEVPLKNTGLTNVAESTLRFVSGGPFSSVPTKRVNALNKMSGGLKAGTSTLVLGNNGGGKTVFLEALAHRLKGYSGEVLWNGVSPATLVAPQKLGTVAPQADVHEPLLTVTETLEFAANLCQAPLPATATPEERALREGLVGHVIDTLGLRECAGVPMGDANTRGVSGGQYKRVTLGEALVTGSRVLALDEITNGLDSAVGEEICAFLAAWAKLTGGTVVCALQAPTPEMLRTFDSVLLLSDGHQLYLGPPGDLEAYLLSLGFPCPSYMDIADFALLVCLSPTFAASSLGLPTKETQETLAVRWAASLPAAALAASASGAAKGGVVLAPASRDAAQYGSTQARTFGASLGLLMGRQAKLVQRNPAVSVGRIIQFLMLASLFGSIYYKLSVDDFVTKISMAIFACSAVAFAAYAEIPAIFVGKRTAARQLAGGFYSPWAYVTSVMVNSLPVGLSSTFLFATIMYWMCGFAQDDGRYFFFTLCLICHELATGSMFRFLAFACPTEELANAAAGILTGSLLIFGGFYISYNQIPNYFYSLYYFSPFSWTVRSMVNSEFTSSPYQVPIGGPLTPLKSDVYLDAFGFAKGMAWQWGGIAYLLAFAFVFGFLLSSLAVKFRGNPTPPGSQRQSEESFIAAAVASEKALGKSNSSSTIQQQGSDASVAPSSEQGVVIIPVGAPTATTTTTTTTTTNTSVLPFTPATLSFTDIAYSVTLKDKSTKVILKNIHGVATPGTMTALMGASGAGKTTLLDVLAFRKTTGKVEGKVVVNSTPATPAMFSALCGFAEQQNEHADYMTVEEAVAFSARLRLPSSVGPMERKAFVDEVLSLLELTPIKGFRTGSLALGEAKRLTIAVEMAANPPILFLDEPTTGLDSRSAAQVMKVLRGVASTGRTVVATIHQPSSSVFFSFDSLILLAPGGLQIYSGAVGKLGGELVSYLQSLPNIKPLPKGVNPATWMLEVLASKKVEEGEGEGEKSTPITAYPTSPQAAATRAGIEGMVGSKLPSPPSFPRPGFTTQLTTLVARMSLYHWRNTSWNGVRLFVYVVLALFFGLLYRGVDDSTSTAFFAKYAVALNGLLFLSIINLNTGLPNFARLRSVFYRERASGIYQPLAYPLSHSIAELPWTAFYALLFTSINYFLVGFKPEAGAFFTATLAVFISGMWFVTLALGFIMFFPVALLASIAGGPTIQISILFAGVNLSRAQLPEGWRWMYDADGFAHSLRLFFLPQYKGDTSPLFDYPTRAYFPGGKEAYMVAILGTTPDKVWDELGYFLAIGFSAFFLAMVFGSRINWQKK